MTRPPPPSDYRAFCGLYGDGVVNASDLAQVQRERQ